MALLINVWLKSVQGRGNGNFIFHHCSQQMDSSEQFIKLCYSFLHQCFSFVFIEHLANHLYTVSVLRSQMSCRQKSPSPCKLLPFFWAGSYPTVILKLPWPDKYNLMYLSLSVFSLEKVLLYSALTMVKVWNVNICFLNSFIK